VRLAAGKTPVSVLSHEHQEEALHSGQPASAPARRTSLAACFVSLLSMRPIGLDQFRTESRIDVPAGGVTVGPGPVTVAGVAWARHKGIAAVEVQVDNGPWQAATPSPRRRQL
jgi:hypothetical protein